MRRYALGVAVVAMTILSVTACGCGAPTPTPAPPVENKTVLASASVGVQVLDVLNNTAVAGVPVYFAACSPNGTADRTIRATGLTGDDGWATFTANYTLDEGQTIYLGASDVEPLVDADLAARAFNGSGHLGAWKSFSYSLLYSGEGDGSASIGCAITVDRDSGKMI